MDEVNHVNMVFFFVVLWCARLFSFFHNDDDYIKVYFHNDDDYIKTYWWKKVNKHVLQTPKSQAHSLNALSYAALFLQGCWIVF